MKRLTTEGNEDRMLDGLEKFQVIAMASTTKQAAETQMGTLCGSIGPCPSAWQTDLFDISYYTPLSCAVVLVM